MEQRQAPTTASLLKKRSFWPIFIVQFFGAFNDNVYKNALIILITYKAYHLGPFNAEQLVALCSGIFILPFFLFSALAGELADKYSKSSLVFIVKIWGVLAMVIGLLAYVFEIFPLLILTLFMMGTQSAFFGPVKYSILPELLTSDELVLGNALFEFGTFVAILFGTILGGLLIDINGWGHYAVGGAVLFFALLEAFFSLKIQKLKAVVPSLKIDFHPLRPTWNILKLPFEHKNVLVSILAISWFWFLGAILLSVLPPFCKDLLNGPPSLVTFCLALFSVGVGVGSLTCTHIGKERLELGLAPLGALGLSFFMIEIFFAGQTLSLPLSQGHHFYALLFANSGAVRLFIDLLLFSFFGGIFIVPLYTLLQERGAADIRSRIIASNNLYNSLFMVGAAIVLMLLFTFLTLPELFLFFGVANLIVCAFLFSLQPEFLVRFVVLCRSFFFKHRDDEELTQDL